MTNNTSDTEGSDRQTEPSNNDVPTHQEAEEQTDSKEPELTLREQLIDELSGILMQLDMVSKTSYSGENHYDTTPNILSITLEYNTDKEAATKLAQQIAGVVKGLTENKVKASVEHPYRHIEDDIVSIKHIDKISIRWNERWATTPSNVRGEGRAVDLSDVEPNMLEDTTKFVDSLLLIDQYDKEQERRQVEEREQTIKCEERGG